ncbi:tetratricopeptide repeat protein [Massilia sp. GCM10023247]|uniref:tetratricopeptide repeat protein n=1 Tax=Massilia sp. GCM10023247 TaxID=3252643 RepID=UPI00360B71A6
MSLINKMLQDLDARGNARAGEVPPEIKPVAPAARRLPPRRIAAVTAALLALALGATAWVMLPLKGKTFEVQPAAPVAAVPAAVPEAPPEALPAAPPEAPPVSVAEVAPAAPASVQAEAPLAAAQAPATPPVAPAAPAAKARSETRQPAPAPAAPRTEAAPHETTSWAVANERALAEQARLAKRWHAEQARIAALPQAERAAPTRRLREEQARAAERARLDAAWLAALKRREAGTGPAPQEAPPAAQGRLDSGAQQAENSYRRALAHLEEGRVAEAIAGLQATLRAHPKHEAARQTLVSLLIESKRGDEAMGQLEQALALDPRQPALAMLLARLQIERGKSGIETLLRSLPYAAGKGDYHAFLAGALQREARYGEAAEQYQTALRSAPGNAVWWMGLGIALQADKRHAEALDAFRQAKALGSLPGELQGFVERKLQQLAR